MLFFVTSPTLGLKQKCFKPPVKEALNCIFYAKLIRKNSRVLQRDLCNYSYHLKCTPMSVRDYNKLLCSWTCQGCISSSFPFHNIDNCDLIKLSFNSNTSCSCSQNTDYDRLAQLPRFEIISYLNNIPQISSFDPEVNITSKVNFNYFTTHEFHSSPDIINSFSDVIFSSPL